MRIRCASLVTIVTLVVLVVGWTGAARASVAGLANVQVTTPINEGDTAHLTGNIDTGCSSTILEVDWGDGTAADDFPEPGVTAFDVTHTYVDDDPTGTAQDAYSIALDLSSSQAGCGGSDQASTRVTVNDVGPSITGGTLTTPVGVGEPATLGGTFTDPGAADTFTLTIDWGDGSNPDQGSLPAGSDTFGGAHAYSKEGNYDVAVTVKDDDTKSNSIGFVEHVLGVAPFLVTAPGKGGAPAVKTFDGDGAFAGQLPSPAFPGFLGGVRVAAGDVNGDGTADIITAPGPGRSPLVKVWNGKDGSLLDSFSAFSRTFQGGVFVAAGDVNGDGHADIAVGADAGAGPHVKVFDRFNTTMLFNALVYAPQFTGGVRVAVGDVNADGFADIITGAGPGGGPHIKVFDGANGNLLQSFFAYAPQFTGGVFVAVGDVNGDLKADVVTGADKGGGPHVKVFDMNGQGGIATLRSFFAYSPSFTGGVRVAAGDVNGDGVADIVTGAGPGGGPHVKVFEGTPALTLHASFFAYSPQFTGGVYVAIGRSLVQNP